MKLKPEFVTHESGGEALLVPSGAADFAGLVRGNQTLGVILSLLREDTTEQALIAALCERYDAPEALIARDLRDVLDKLRAIGALDE